MYAQDKLNEAFSIQLKNMDRRVENIEEAIKLLTDLRISDRELQVKLQNIEEKIKSRDRLFYFLISPLYGSAIGTLIYFILGG